MDKQISINELIRIIEEFEADLDDLDIEGHIWWNKFKELIQKL